MKKIISIILSLFVISNCYAIDIVLSGEGTNSDYTIAKYLASKQIDEQFSKLKDNPFRFASQFEESVRTYNDYIITYNNYIVCTIFTQGDELHGNPIYFKRKITEWLNCEETQEFQTVKISCQINDDVINEIKKTLTENVEYSDQFCENHFLNEFQNKVTGKTKIQKGIIFGYITFQDYYDNKGIFYTIDYGKDNWLGEHEEKLFYFGNITKRDFEKNKYLLEKKID